MKNTVLIVALAVALAAALGLAAVSLAHANNAGKRANKLNDEVAALSEQLASTKPVDLSGISARVSAAQAKVSAAQAKDEQTAKAVTHIQYCLPELVNLVNSESFHGFDDNGWLTGGYIDRDYNAISRFCSDILRTQPSGGEGEGA